MPLIRGSLSQSAGAVIDVQIGIGRLRKRNLLRLDLPVPAPVTVRAQIDTGSGISGFPRRVFDQLEIGSVGTRSIYTPSTPDDQPCECDLFDVTLSLVANAISHPILETRVIAATGWRPEREDGVEGLIGRDVLSKVTLKYFGAEKAFSFGF
jgi:hypothetical protein